MGLPLSLFVVFTMYWGLFVVFYGGAKVVSASRGHSLKLGLLDSLDAYLNKVARIEPLIELWSHCYRVGGPPLAVRVSFPSVNEWGVGSG